MKKKVERRIKIILASAILPVLLVIIWESCGRKGLLNQSILPSPGTLAAAVREMIAAGKLQTHLAVSGIRVIKGFLLGGSIGIILGIIIALSPRLHRLLSAFIGILRPIPIIAWVPMLILWMGIDESSKVTLIAIGSFWPILINTAGGIQNIDKKLLEVGVILEKSKWEILKNIILPSAMPYIFAGVRLGISAAWSCVVTAEMLGAAAGIGFIIMYARELSQPDIMLVGVFSIGFIGLLLDVILLRIERKVLDWNIGA